MIERISFKVAARALGYTSYRGFRSWCIRNKVALLKDTGSNRLYVMKAEFEYAVNKEILKHLTYEYKINTTIE